MGTGGDWGGGEREGGGREEGGREPQWRREPPGRHSGGQAGMDIGEWLVVVTLGAPTPALVWLASWGLALQLGLVGLTEERR